MKLLKKNIKLIVSVIVLMIIVSGISVYATSTYFASQVNYIKQDGTTVTVSDALNDLYSKNIYNNYMDINMTTYESDKFSVQASSEWTKDSSLGYKIFDNSIESFENTWVSGNTNKPQWIDLNFEESQNIYAFSFYPQCNNFNARLPKDVIIYTSQDGSSWNQIYAGQTDGCDYRWHYTILNNSANSKYWRIQFNSTWGSDGFTSVAELRIHTSN